MILARVAKREWIPKSLPLFFRGGRPTYITYNTYRSYSQSITDGIFEKVRFRIRIF